MNGNIITALTIISLCANMFSQDNVVDASGNLALLSHNYSIPAGGKLISDENLLNRYSTNNGRKHSYGSFSKASFDGTQNLNVVDVSISSKPKNPWDVQILGHIKSPVRKGETLFVSLLARTLSAQDETGDGKITVFAQLNRAPHSKFLYNTTSVGHQWTRIHYPFKADRDYAADNAAFGVFLGYRIQKIQIADLKLYNYGRNKKISNGLGGKTNKTEKLVFRLSNGLKSEILQCADTVLSGRRGNTHHGILRV